MPDPLEDNRLIGANITYSFYNNVAYLKSLASQQLNILATINAKYKPQNENYESLLTQEEGLALKNLNDMIRATLQYIFYDYQALAQDFEETEEQIKKVGEAWAELQFKQHLEKKLLDQLISEYNRVIVKKVSKRFFKVASDEIAALK
jgi:hypothetical protein